MTYIKDYRENVGINPEKFYKTTLFQTPHLLLGLNCLEPRQVQKVHSHIGQDKFYYVIEGQGEFTIGDEKQVVGVGFTVWAPADIDHGVANTGDQRLVLLVGIAPSP